VVDFARPGSAPRSWRGWTVIGAGSVAAIAAVAALLWLAVTTLVVPSAYDGKPTSPRFAWNIPQQIGPYQLVDDRLDLAEDLHQALLDRGLSGGIAANYENWARGFEVVVWGANGETVTQADRRREMDALFTDVADILGREGVVASRVPVSAGAVGGAAECGLVGETNLVNPMKNVMICAWVHDGAMAGIYLTGYTPDRAGEIVPALLEAVVRAT
jgi:hypothetical protein